MVYIQKPYYTKCSYKYLRVVYEVGQINLNLSFTWYLNMCKATYNKQYNVTKYSNKRVGTYFIYFLNKISVHKMTIICILLVWNTGYILLFNTRITPLIRCTSRHSKYRLNPGVKPAKN